MVKITILGPIEVVGDGGPLQLPRRQSWLVLGILALEANKVVTTERLLDLIWGDEPPPSARAVLQSRISELRTGILNANPAGDARILPAVGGYRLTVAPEAVDAERFRTLVTEASAATSYRDGAAKLRAALALWRGPALGGLLRESVRSAICGGLEAARLSAYEQLFEFEIALGRHVSVADELLPLVADNPGRERLTEQLMLAQHFCGRTSEALQTYDRCRRWLTEELGVDPGKSLQELHLKLLRGEDIVAPAATNDRLSTQAVPRHAEAASAHDTPCRYLPRDTNDFTGRGLELADLAACTATHSTALVITAIDGMGGVGKTALAVHLAHQLADNYPDGQLFIDLHGFSADRPPVTPDRGLEMLLRQLGLPEELISFDLDEKSALWRAEMANRRALVLLDNAHDEAQIRPLMPGATSALVLVTSRRKMTALEGAVPYPLDTLPLDDAIDLFVAVAGRRRTERSQLTEIVQACGNLPLAIRLAAARYRDRPAWTADDLLRQLRSHRQRTKALAAGDRNVSAALALSYQHLDTSARRIFRLLSLHPGANFDAQAAAALANVPLDIAEDCLDALFEYNLLLQAKAGWFEFHDLVRACAHDLLLQHETEEEQLAATHRILDHYLDFAYNHCQPAAKGLFLGFDGDRPQPRSSGGETDWVALLKTHHRSLIAAARYAAEHGWQRHAWMIPCAMMPYLATLNYTADSRDLFEGGLAAAEKNGAARGEVMCLTVLIQIARDREGDNARATALVERAMHIARREGDLRGQAHLKNELAVLLNSTGQSVRAEEEFSAVRELAIASNDRRLVASATTNLGIASLELGKYSEALRLFLQATELGRDVNPPRAGVIIDLNSAVALNALGDVDTAMSTIEKALAAAQRIGEPGLEAWTLSLRSTTQRMLGNIEAAVINGRQALELARQVHRPDVECDALLSLGEAMLARKDLQVADGLFRQAAALAQNLSLRAQQGRAAEGQAHAQLAEGNIAAARENWQQAANLHYPDTIGARNAATHLAALPGGKGACPQCASVPALTSPWCP